MAEQGNFLALLEQEKPTLQALLPKYVSFDRWFALAYEVSKSKDLQRIAQENPLSLLNAMKRLADWGLQLDGEEAIIIAYGDEAEAQAMYKGLIRRAIDARVAVHIYAELVRDGEPVEIVSGSHREIKHTPNPFAAKGKKILGAYAVAILANGLTDFELFTEDDIASVRAAALRMAQRRKKDAGESPAWRFQPGEMIKKSVIRRLCKRLRGARDTDAGRRFAQVMETPGEQVIDAEIEGRDIGTLSEEETPRAADDRTFEQVDAGLYVSRPVMAVMDEADRLAPLRAAEMQITERMAREAEAMRGAALVEVGEKDATLHTILTAVAGIDEPATPAERGEFKTWIKGRARPKDIMAIKEIPGWTDLEHATKRQLQAAREMLEEAK